MGRTLYDDLIAPSIVRQVSKSVAYCRCTRTKNPPFCDGSHAVTSITPHILEFERSHNHRYLPLLEIEGSSLLRRHPWTPGQAQRLNGKKPRIINDSA